MRRLYAAIPLLLASATVFAQAQPPRALPTLSEYGIGALVILVGAVGAWVARRK